MLVRRRAEETRFHGSAQSREKRAMKHMCKQFHCRLESKGTDCNVAMFLFFIEVTSCDGMDVCMHDMCVVLYLLGWSLHLLEGACFCALTSLKCSTRGFYRMRPWKMHRRRSGCDTICSTCFRAIIFLHSVLLLCSRMRELAEAASIDDLAVNRKHGNQTCDLLRSVPEHEMASRLCLYSVSTILQSRRTKPRTSPCSSRMSWYGLWKVNEPEDLMSRQESLLGNRADLTPFWTKCIWL